MPPSMRGKRLREQGLDGELAHSSDEVARVEHASDGSVVTTEGGEKTAQGTGAESLPSSTTFGFYVWTEVSMVLFYRFLKEIQETFVALATLSDDSLRQRQRLHEFEMTMDLIWRVGRAHLPESERSLHDKPLALFTQDLVEQTRVALSAGSTGAAASATSSVGSSNVIDTSKALEKVMEDSGFPDEEGGSLQDSSCQMGVLAQLIADTRQGCELNCYSYSERTTLAMPLLPRYDGDKRTDEEHTHPRAGYTVELPCPHPHPEINTSIQLIEPKKRRPPLDDYRIFSHPKKTITHGAEDFLVDEELNHRAFVVLRQHMDTYGSLQNLPPYARFLLWNVVLERDEVLFEKLCDQPATSTDTRRRLDEVRVALGGRYAAFNEVRVGARESAQRIGWYAVSAQWRDQALCRLESAEDTDWYLMGEVAKLGGKSVFPNFASCDAIRAATLATVEKLDAFYASRRDVDCDESVPVAPVTRSLLVPLLLGDSPDAVDWGGTAADSTQQNAHFQRDRRRLRGMMTRKAVSGPPAANVDGTVTTDDGQSNTAGTHSVCAFVSQSFLFALQTLSEMLDLMSLAQAAERGLDTFTDELLRADWHEEEGVLRFLLATEPMNCAVAPLAALPRLYRDLVTAVQLLSHERMVNAVVEARRLAGEQGLSQSREHTYLYWKALSTVFQEEGRQEDLLLLSVQRASSASCSGARVEANRPLYSEGSVERAPRVWPEDLAELIEQETLLRSSECASSFK